MLALLGVGFGLLEMLNRPEPVATTMALAQVDTPAPSATGLATLNAASVGPSIEVGGSNDPPAARQIQTNAKVLDANYTVAAGDTLVRIAQQFNTSVARIQAFNNLADPRALRVGTKLIIPPPL